ncbi:hypothetical protein [Sphingopyxis bauzanensis]|uniref:hypothetical protein n=1 Tax=Sphingopyxis bauzanensis TaxID=651663 RepID=UPI00118192CC|nr:hypothetical protein [Sphingopyxis bauzanensis]GGJ65729.1 hypothetical protein GCM10011393_40060 [Sphingopyxis bauzanensis]
MMNLNRHYVLIEEYKSIQEAFDAAASLGVELHLRPGETYRWPTVGVTVNGKVRVVARGARIEVSSASTALTFVAGASGSEIEGGEWIFTGRRATDRVAGANAILVTGTRNGARTAPTFVENIRIRNSVFAYFGGIAIEFRYARNCGDEYVKVLNCGFAGIFCYSVDTYRSDSLLVDGLTGQLDAENSAASELNAYGFTATAQTGGMPDRVRDPYSRDIVVARATIINVPTWHAIDSHGSEGMIITDATIRNCRRGIVFTGLTDRGTSNSKAVRCYATNSFSATATNANGTSKKGEAFWDVGPSPAHRNGYNRFERCSCFGHGNPSSDDGAIRVENVDNGYYNIEDIQSQRVGWRFGSNVFRATIDAHSVNTRHESVDPSVARVEGSSIDLRIVRWTAGARDFSVDTKVMVNGLVIGRDNTDVSIYFGKFNLDSCVSGSVISTRGNLISARLYGNYGRDKLE